MGSHLFEGREGDIGLKRHAAREDDLHGFVNPALARRQGLAGVGVLRLLGSGGGGHVAVEVGNEVRGTIVCYT